MEYQKLVMTMIVALASASYVAAQNCTYTNEPPSGWYESFDSSNFQSYCIPPNTTTPTLSIHMPIMTDINGIYFTPTNPDVWTTTNYEQNSGNIRNVRVTFEYYFPSYNGICVPTAIKTNGQYASAQLVLVTNKESNLSQEGTFDDAFYQLNNEITCDTWKVFNHSIQEFENDWGSSFSGQSKSIGSIGFEIKNAQIRNVNIHGVTKVTVW